MKPITIRTTSILNAAFALFLFLVILIPIALVRNRLLPVPLDTLTSIFLTIPVLIFFYFLFKNVGTAKTEWSINESNIHIHWVTNFIFLKKTDSTIDWEQIEYYKKTEDPWYTTLIIKPIHGKKIKFYFSKFLFSNFSDDLIERLDSFHPQKKIR